MVKPLSLRQRRRLNDLRLATPSRTVIPPYSYSSPNSSYSTNTYSASSYPPINSSYSSSNTNSNYSYPRTNSLYSSSITYSNSSYPPNNSSYSSSNYSTSNSTPSYTHTSINSPYLSSFPSNLEANYYYTPVAPLPIFRGESNECPFLHLIRFDHVCQANNAVSIAARNFPASLDSKAALWYKIAIKPSMSFEQICSAFISSFKPRAIKSRSELFSLHQSDNETVNHYHLKLQLILLQWPEHKIPDEQLKTIFISGLNKELKDWVSPEKPITLNEAFILAMSWEQAEEIREVRNRGLEKDGEVKIKKCGFCGVEGHEEGICEARNRMRELWAKKGDSIKGSLRVGKTGRFNRQCSCPVHKCNSVKSDQEVFYDAEGS